MRVQPIVNDSKFPLVISHLWLTPEHPDPSARHLGMVVNWMQTEASNWNKGQCYSDVVSAIFWDFSSLSQKERTRSEFDGSSLVAILAYWR